MLLTEAQLAAGQEVDPLNFASWPVVEGDSDQVFFMMDSEYLVSASATHGASGINAQYAGKQLGSAYSSNVDGDGPRGQRGDASERA